MRKELHAINKKAQTIMDRLMDFKGQAVKYESDGYMPLNIDRMWHVPGAGQIIAMSHNYTQNGDVMNDPEMLILRADIDGRYYAISYRQDGLGLYKESVIFNADGKTCRVNRPLQRQQSIFLGCWLKNIENQGFLESATASKAS